jgi:hypothetical protein
MSGQTNEGTAPDSRLQEVLLAYLLAPTAPKLPGADGLTVEDVLRSYPQAAAAGCVPNRGELVRRHPELTGALDTFFTN